ncbi:MAG: hypothetical protein ABSF25_00995 [Bryobacteraceae bacterium]
METVMSLSKDARLQNLEEAIRLLMGSLHGQCFMGVLLDERYDVDERILGTTWDELKSRSLVRQTNSRWSYTLSGRGWILGLKLLGEFGTDEMRGKVGTLCSVLKAKVKGRAHANYATVGDIATESGLSDGFVRDAIESDLIRELFGTKGAEWSPQDRGSSIRIPNDFGLPPLS